MAGSRNNFDHERFPARLISAALDTMTMEYKAQVLCGGPEELPNEGWVQWAIRILGVLGIRYRVNIAI